MTNGGKPFSCEVRESSELDAVFFTLTSPMKAGVDGDCTKLQTEINDQIVKRTTRFVFHLDGLLHITAAAASALMDLSSQLKKRRVCGLVILQGFTIDHKAIMVVTRDQPEEYFTIVVAGDNKEVRRLLDEHRRKMAGTVQIAE